MASELRVNTLKDASGNNSIATSFVAGGSAKAWVFYNSSQAIQDSFSVSSVTDRATGRHTINIASAMANATYTVAGQGSWRDASSDANTLQLTFERINTVSITNTACPVQTTYYGSSGNLGDANATTANIHGDLA
mgnify:FL=1